MSKKRDKEIRKLEITVDKISQQVKDKQTGKTFEKTTSLSQRQRNFAHYFVKYGNGTKAAIASGYSEKGVNAVVNKNLRHPAILLAIEKERRKIYRHLLRTTKVTAEHLVAEMQIIKEKALNGTPIFDEHGAFLGYSGEDHKLALKAIVSQAKALGIGSFSNQAKLEINNNVNVSGENSKYDFSTLSSEEKINLVELLQKCRVPEHSNEIRSIRSNMDAIDVESSDLPLI